MAGIKWEMFPNRKFNAKCGEYELYVDGNGKWGYALWIIMKNGSLIDHAMYHSQISGSSLELSGKAAVERRIKVLMSSEEETKLIGVN